MWKLRIFNIENASKMDKLLGYLKARKLSYTFHTDKTRDSEILFKVFWLD